LRGRQNVIRRLERGEEFLINVYEGLHLDVVFTER